MKQSSLVRIYPSLFLWGQTYQKKKKVEGALFGHKLFPANIEATGVIYYNLSCKDVISDNFQVKLKQTSLDV